MTDLHDAPPEPEATSELFVEYANTLAFTDGAGHDRVEDPHALVDWLRQHGLLRARPSVSRVERDLPRFRELRQLVRGIATRAADDRSPTTTQLRALNRVLRDGLHYHQLHAVEDGARFTIGQVGDELDQARASIAGSLAHFLADHDAHRLRICADDGCRWLFVDHSPAGRRRWCDMRTCGNRAKVARHRARARGQAQGASA
ncbi:MAG: CGNR zinc finger domain-containing protein [Candidatus Limnocylindria bacterium]